MELEEERNYCLNCINKPCSNIGCPLGNDIPKFIKEKDCQKAFEILCQTTVLPAICGRICPKSRYCQASCIQGIQKTPVEIGKIEAYIGDMAIKNNYAIPKYENPKYENPKYKNPKYENPKYENSKYENSKYENSKYENSKYENPNAKYIDKVNKRGRVAVVGSGPAGLTCAAFLAMHGIQVTIYEKNKKLGGILRYGIPSFRLDKKIVDESIKKILDLGISTETQKELGKDINIKELTKKYDAVFISIGTEKPKKTLEGENILSGNQLLEKVQKKEKIPNFENKKIIVYGGGNVAIDTARTLKRLKADVSIVYRRTIDQMPADILEIKDAQNEEIKIIEKTNIISYKNGIANCIKTRLVEKNKTPADTKNAIRNKTKIENIDGTNFKMKADYIVLAIGTKANVELLKSQEIETDERGFAKIDTNYRTSQKKVYAGGDLLGKEATVAFAARSGRNAAQEIINDLLNYE